MEQEKLSQEKLSQEKLPVEEVPVVPPPFNPESTTEEPATAARASEPIVNPADPSMLAELITRAVAEGYRIGREEATARETPPVVDADDDGGKADDDESDCGFPVYTRRSVWD